MNDSSLHNQDSPLHKGFSPEELEKAENGKKAAEELMDQFDKIISKYDLDAHYVVGVISNVFALAMAECGTPDEIFNDVCGWVKNDFVKFKAMIEASKKK